MRLGKGLAVVLLAGLAACGGSKPAPGTGSCNVDAGDYCYDVSPVLSTDPADCQGQGGVWSTAACASPDVGTCTFTAGGQTGWVRFYTPTWNDTNAGQFCARVSGTYTPAARLLASPPGLAFQQFAGGAAPAAQTLAISASGGGSAGWTASVSYVGSTGWLTVAPAGGGALPAQVQVSADGAGLGAGSHGATIRFASSLASVDVPVSLTVTAPGIVPTPASVDFAAVSGGAIPAPQDVALDVTSGPALTFATQEIYGAGAAGWLTVTPPASAPGTLRLVPNLASLAPATYLATLTLTPSNGAPAASISVSYTLAPAALHVAPTSLAFAAVQGQVNPPASQSLTLTTDESVTVGYATSVSYGAGAPGWLAFAATGSAPGSLSVGIATTSLAPGSYAGTLRLSPQNGAAPVDVPVGYQVLAPALSATPASLAFTVNAATTPAQAQAVVSLAHSGSPVAWSASATAPWLQVSPTSGVTGAVAGTTVSLVPAGLEGLANGAHAAEVVISFLDGGEPVELRIPVALTMSLPLLTLAAPRAEVSGAQAEVVLRGTGLDLGGTVRFGAAQALATTLVGPTEIRATHDALAAGTVLVRIDNALGLARSTAGLTVVDPTTRSAASTASPGAKQKVIFDDARATAFVVNTGGGVLERYRTSTGWAREPLSLANLRDAALSPDGAKLVAVTGTEIWEIDPDAFALPGARAAALGPGTWRIAFANDGQAVLAANDLGFTPCQRYDPVGRAISPVGPSCDYYQGGNGASADGSRVAVVGSGVSPAQAAGFYLGSTSAFQGSAVGVSANVVELDRSGNRIVALRDFAPNLLANGVYDAAWALLGQLGQASPNNSLLRVVLRRDGALAVAWDDGAGRVRLYDLTAAPVAGFFPEVGTGVTPMTVPGAASSRTTRLALSADGRTAFLAGDQAFVVVPLP